MVLTLFFKFTSVQWFSFLTTKKVHCDKGNVASTNWQITTVLFHWGIHAAASFLDLRFKGWNIKLLLHLTGLQSKQLSLPGCQKEALKMWKIKAFLLGMLQEFSLRSASHVHQKGLMLCNHRGRFKGSNLHCTPKLLTYQLKNENYHL